ncbi:MAG: SAM-dependent methyltransferase [Proteobacteria bacterium]|nr:SAM-dependent methyltransferase [Pseudomonadota bacterium]
MPSDFLTSVKTMITLTGPLSMDRFMERAIQHYYANKQPFGADGDFITAPEISQMFGQTIAMWLAEHWLSFNSPILSIVELGPGRGVMLVDILKACYRLPRFAEALQTVYLVEKSRALREVQRTQLLQHGFISLVEQGRVIWIDDVEVINHEQNEAIFLLANEFFDALPVKQYACENGKTYEVCVGLSDGKLARMLMEIGAQEPNELAIREGQLLEISKEAEHCMAKLSYMMKRFSHYAGLVIDYGYIELPYTNTIQALLRHKQVDMLEHVGVADVTALVNFSALSMQLQGHDIAHRVCTQREFLCRHHIQERAKILTQGGADAELIKWQLERLIALDQMGELFKVLEIMG